jgi:hypothetical protein
MRKKRASLLAVTLAALAALVVAPTTAMAAKPGTQLDPALCAPDENSFSLTIDNSYFPLPVDQVWVYQGKEQGQTIGLQISVLDETENLYRGSRTVTTRVVEETEWEDANGNGVIDGDESLIEVSRNFFAQTQDGTVCYFGEEVDIYEGGVIVSHEGAWRADQRGNAPGIFMPAEPRVGLT